MSSRERPGANRPQVHILHLEDNALDGDLVCEYLHAEGLDCQLERVWTREDFTGALNRRAHDLILADHQLPNFDGEAALVIARELAPETPFIFVSGTLGEDVAVEAMKRGATDYVVKQRLDRLPAVVQRALDEAAERIRRREVEASLRESETRFAILVHAMPQLCWIANADGYITWYNQRWHDYTGTSPEQMEGWGWQSVHDPAKLPEVLARWQASIDTGQPFEMTFPLRGADGVFRPFLTRAEPVRDESGQIERWLGTNTDVSAQHEAEEALRRLNETLEQRIAEATAEREEMLAKLHEAQKLETIGQLTGGVAHDFNNLLTPIVGSLDLLRRRQEGDDRTHRLISGALQAADRAKTLVQRLLAFGRRQVLESRPVDVSQLVDGMADLITRSIGPQIRLEIEAAADLPAAQVDPNQLELALLNLAVNARDAMPGGGSLKIEVEETLIAQEHPGLRAGRYIRICVTDSGIGMDEATLRRAVEPFYSTKGIGKGTGLGLSMVHGLAGQSGGALALSSTPGDGTRAEMWLPVAEARAQSAAEQEPFVPAQVDPLHILLVDDEPLVRSATAALLAERGHHVVEAESGFEALQILRSGSTPDLIITDYLMPGMNGAELARELRSGRPDIPILLLTGYANLEGLAAIELPLLAKPFREADLAAIIERVVAGSRPSTSGRRGANLHVVEG